MKTRQSILQILDESICDRPETFQAFSQQLKVPGLTRDENPQAHFCVYFLPYNPQTKKVFITHHKKSGLWLSPGGHLDKNETLLEALNREINEELGVKDFFPAEPRPFLLTITPINNDVHPCRLHYDVWYLVATDGAIFNLDLREFYDTKWLLVAEAKKLVTDLPNLKALSIVEKM